MKAKVSPQLVRESSAVNTADCDDTKARLQREAIEGATALCVEKRDAKDRAKIPALGTAAIRPRPACMAAHRWSPVSRSASTACSPPTPGSRRHVIPTGLDLSGSVIGQLHGRFPAPRAPGSVS